jgi:nitroreductase
MTTPAELPLTLTPDELLTTTRAVRKRFDLTRPVEPSVLRECLVIAQQAPTGSNRQIWHFVVVTDPEKRAALGRIYRRGWESVQQASPTAVTRLTFDAPARAADHARVVSSARFLAEHLGEVPVHLIPCIEGRFDGLPVAAQAGMFGSILPAAWSFMLAARTRGLGTCLTTVHLLFEEEAAEVLRVPYSQVTQIALIPVAYTRGTSFKPAPRESLEDMVHWDTW